MSDKKETPPTNKPPAAPATSNKARKRQRPRGGKKIRKLEKAFASGADTASGVATASSAGPESSKPPATSQPAASPPAASTSAPRNTGVAVSVDLAHRTTLASLVPGIDLTDEEVAALAGYLPDIITAFVQGRRLR
ncbi:hypothetical protein PENNAL_c0120G04932 [Penicillium nalgiovense]|uniref:Uncharacterized protein n=1 Tax=Penicillium nalgiovense TaxID=60175 RepID=A0A1V6X4X2_PENNA|nr:hypothetical protein PENNAL_c0120G04932 [Penicillium nalgiovense]